MFCGENCKDIFNLMQRHSIGELSDQEAIEELEKRDLTVVEKSTEAIKDQLKRILSKKDAVEAAEMVEVKEDSNEDLTPIQVQPKRRKKVTNKEQ